MNRYMEEKWSWVEGSHDMRMQLLDSLSDADLAFTPGGTAMTLGALCREWSEIEHSYVQSLKTFTQDWTYRNTEPGLESSISQLKAWFDQLDAEMKNVVSAFSDDDLKKTVDRSGYPAPVEMQLEVYLQALLIFFGKASIYLRAMNKPLPGSLEQWVG
jgi:hypothetical protein